MSEFVRFVEVGSKHRCDYTDENGNVLMQGPERRTPELALESARNRASSALGALRMARVPKKRRESRKDSAESFSMGGGK